ncbi:MAG: dihydropteroate synthase [Flavobacteriaceae bacterium]|jgi:dihydropteroate synthase|uniref:dihydropteroate synthase n=1 Tax=Candidatus Marifrigoribacter sp. Uisw_064 TaxID=3230970 RepID=UPI003AEAAE0E
MGILNITPDSFFDGGSLISEKEVLQKAEKMLEEGATFLDVGGYSSRPRADFVTEEEEIKRVIPVIQLLNKEFPEAILSIDTFRSKIAEMAVLAEAAIVNDISGGSLDNQMFETIAKLKVPYIVMHMRGTPKTMVNLTEYEDVTKDLLYYFSEKLKKATSLGIKDVILDPGFGFAKTQEQNFELMNHLELFQHLDAPLLVGISRKSMIYTSLKNSPKEALNGTTALHSIALLKGANILRVHDVKEAKECITLMQNLKGNI